MTRVTEFPEDEEKEPREEPEDEVKELREKPARVAGGGDEGGERTIRLPRLPLGKRIKEFYHNIKLEMRKTTWPTRSDVWSTTVVVLIAIVFFGFYLWGADLLITRGFEALENALK